MNVFVLLLLFSVGSLTQIKTYSLAELSHGSSLQSIRSLKSISTTPNDAQYVESILSTSEDPFIEEKRKDCESCLRAHRECETLAECKICHFSCKVFEEDAKPTTTRITTEGETISACDMCLRKNSKCKSALKCEACKAVCKITDKDVQASLRAASRCRICRESSRCKRHAKCDHCKRYCEPNDENIQTTTAESTKPLQTTTELPHYIQSLKGPRKTELASFSQRNKPKMLRAVERDVHESSDDIIGEAAPMQQNCTPILIFPAVSNAENMQGASLSQTAPRYYTIGAFLPGPRMNHFLHLLNVRRTEDIEKLIVIAKLKSNQASAENEIPIIIDYTKLMQDTDTQVGPGNRIDGPSIGLSSEIDRALQMAAEQKKVSKGTSSLTPDETFKVIQHAILLHDTEEERTTVIAQTSPIAETGAEALIDETVTDTAVIGQTPRVPARDLIQEKPPKSAMAEAFPLTLSEGMQAAEVMDTKRSMPFTKLEDGKLQLERDFENENAASPKERYMTTPFLVQEASSITPLEIKIRKTLEEARKSLKKFSEEDSTESVTSTTLSKELFITEKISTNEQTNTQNSETEEPIMGSRNKDMLTEETTATERTSSTNENYAPNRDMMKELKKVVDDRTKALHEATMVGKQRIEGALNKMKEILNTDIGNDNKDNIVGMIEEVTTQTIGIEGNNTHSEPGSVIIEKLLKKTIDDQKTALRNATVVGREKLEDVLHKMKNTLENDLRNDREGIVGTEQEVTTEAEDEEASISMDAETTEMSSETSEELQTHVSDSDVMKDLKKTIDERRKAVNEAIIAGKQAVESDLDAMKGMLHKKIENDKDNIIGMEQETTTQVTKEEANEEEVRKFMKQMSYRVIDDLTGSGNLTQTKKENIKEEIPKLVKSTIDAATQQGVEQEEDSVKKKLDQTGRTIETVGSSSSREESRKIRPSKGSNAKKEQLKKVLLKHKKDEEQVAEPFIIEAEDITSTTSKALLNSDKTIKAIKNEDFAKAFIKDVTDVPNYIMNKMESLVKHIPEHGLRFPTNRILGKEIPVVRDATLLEQRESQSTRIKDFDKETYTGTDDMLPKKHITETKGPIVGGHQQKSDNIGLNFYTSTISPTAPRIFTEYEETTLSTYHDRKTKISSTIDTQEDFDSATQQTLPEMKETKVDEYQQKYEEIDLMSITPTSVQVSPEYESTTFNIYHERQSEDFAQNENQFKTHQKSLEMKEPNLREPQSKSDKINLSLHTTSTTSPTAPWVFPEYESTTLSKYHGRQNEGSDPISAAQKMVLPSKTRQSDLSQSLENMKDLLHKIPEHRFKVSEKKIRPFEQSVIGERLQKSDNIDLSFYTTSTSSPTAPWVFPEYEGTTLNVDHGRQSQNFDINIGKKMDWIPENQSTDSFEISNTFARIVPTKDSSKVVSHKFKEMVKNAYFYGNMKVPLRMKYYPDGTIKLAVDKKKYCQCSDSHCDTHHKATHQNIQTDVMQLDEVQNVQNNSESAESFKDAVVGMSVPIILNRNSEVDIETAKQSTEESMEESWESSATDDEETTTIMNSTDKNSESAKQNTVESIPQNVQNNSESAELFKDAIVGMSAPIKLNRNSKIDIETAKQSTEESMEESWESSAIDNEETAIIMNSTDKNSESAKQNTESMEESWENSAIDDEETTTIMNSIDKNSALNDLTQSEITTRLYTENQTKNFESTEIPIKHLQAADERRGDQISTESIIRARHWDPKNLPHNIEPVNDITQMKGKIQSKRESIYAKKMKERKSRLSAKIEKKKDAFKRSPLKEMRESNERVCLGSSCKQRK